MILIPFIFYNKDGNPDVGYNIQTAVDCESKMFIALIVFAESNRSPPIPIHNEQIH